MRQESKRNTEGFTLVELMVVLAVLTVLVSMLIPAFTGHIEEAGKKRYLVEAEKVKDSVELYLLERHPKGNVDAMMVMEEFSEYELTSAKNPLAEYLLVECTDGAYIQNLTLTGDGREVRELIYVVGGYRIELADGRQSVKKVR